MPNSGIMIGNWSRRQNEMQEFTYLGYFAIVRKKWHMAFLAAVCNLTWNVKKVKTSRLSRLE